MTALEKRKEEQEELLLQRKNRILQASFKLFSKNGMDSIAMTDIAKDAEIGVASLYRYYATKEEIAIRTAIWAWQQMKEIILPAVKVPGYENLSGLEQLEKICNMFVILCKSNKEFLSFIYFFDSYVIRQHVVSESMKDYETEISFVKDFVVQAIQKGLNDKSIKKEYENQENILYFTVMHTLFSTAQKLSLSGDMLEMDKVVSPDQQMKFLINLILAQLKN